MLLLWITACSHHAAHRTLDTLQMTTPQTTSEILGIDISHYQGKIDWLKLPTQRNIDFVIIKATQGNTWVDGEYRHNWQQAQNTPLLIGVYHYLDTRIDGTAQAEHFIKTTQGQFGDFSPVVDIEALEHEKADDVIGVLAAFIAIIEQHSQCQPIIYTSHGFWSQLHDHDFGKYPLWLADYALQPTLPNGWQDWQLWQFKDNATVSGIKGPVDKSKLKYSSNNKSPLFCQPT